MTTESRQIRCSAEDARLVPNPNACIATRSVHWLCKCHAWDQVV